MSSTNNAVFAVTSDHNLYYKSFDSSSWHHATELANRVQSIASGFDHSLVLTTSGEVMSFGSSNEYGQLGRTTTDPYWVAPVEGFTGKRIVQVCCGGHHSLAIDDEGVLYSWGYGGWGQLGNTDFEHSALPQPVTSFGSKVVEVAAGAFHTLALTLERELYACGCSTYGQLGLGDYDDRSGFCRVDLEAIEDSCMCAVDSIHAGGNHSVIRMANGALCVWGMGLRDPQTETAPKNVSMSPSDEVSDMDCCPYPVVLPEMLALQVSCGLNSISLLVGDTLAREKVAPTPLEILETCLSDPDSDSTPAHGKGEPTLWIWTLAQGKDSRPVQVDLKTVQASATHVCRVVCWKQIFSVKAPSDMTFATTDVQEGVDWKTLRAATQEMYIHGQRVMQTKPMIHHVQAHARDIGFHGERIASLDRRCRTTWPKREDEIASLLSELQSLSSALHGDVRDEYRLIRHAWNAEAARVGIGKRLAPRSYVTQAHVTGKREDRSFGRKDSVSEADDDDAEDKGERSFLRLSATKGPLAEAQRRKRELEQEEHQRKKEEEERKKEEDERKEQARALDQQRRQEEDDRRRKEAAKRRLENVESLRNRPQRSASNEQPASPSHDNSEAGDSLSAEDASLLAMFAERQHTSDGVADRLVTLPSQEEHILVKGELDYRSDVSLPKLLLDSEVDLNSEFELELQRRLRELDMDHTNGAQTVSFTSNVEQDWTADTI